MMNKQNNRIEFINHPNGNIEICYYDTPAYPFCLNWKIPKYIVGELVKWWGGIKSSKKTIFPIIKKLTRCEFAMQTERYVDIKEFDSLGRYTVIGWSLPRIIVDELTIWQKDAHEDTSHK